MSEDKKPLHQTTITLRHTLIEKCGIPPKKVMLSKLSGRPDLVIWCREHPWEAAHEIERLRGSLEIAGEGDGAL